MRHNENREEFIQNIIDGIGAILVIAITIGIAFFFAYLFVNMFS